MIQSRISTALVVLAASAGLAGCTNFGPYGGIGVGVGSGYGYGGYGGYGYDPYYAGYGYGYDPYGWYNGFYYPGTGYWVYDPDRNRRRMTPEEQAHWRARILAKYGSATAPTRENWDGFGTLARKQLASPTSAKSISAATTATATGQADQRQISEARRQQQEVARTERQQARSERQETFRQQVLERREARRAAKPTDE